MQIKENPLNTLVAPVERPEWLCKHPDAKVLDAERKRFLCFVCNPVSGRMKKVPQGLFMEVLRKESLEREE